MKYWIFSSINPESLLWFTQIPVIFLIIINLLIVNQTRLDYSNRTTNERRMNFFIWNESLMDASFLKRATPSVCLQDLANPDVSKGRTRHSYCVPSPSPLYNALALLNHDHFPLLTSHSTLLFIIIMKRLLLELCATLLCPWENRLAFKLFVVFSHYFSVILIPEAPISAVNVLWTLLW